MRKDVILRKLDTKDLPAVTAVHLAAFPKSAMTLLGAEAVRRYYEWVLTGPHEVLPSGAFMEGRCVGFCFSGIFRGATSGFLRRNRLFLTGRVLTRPWLISNPLFRDRISFSLNILNRRTKPSQILPDQSSRGTKRTRVHSFGILAIAVDPGCQGGGVGKLLMAEAEEAARRQGYRMMHLTVSPDNHQAVKFYESLHWKKFVRENLWEGAMKKSLNN